jgi:hypothetical protein
MGSSVRRRLALRTGAWIAVGVPLVVGALQLAHPSWSGGSISDAVLETGPWWVPLHVLLLVGYVALALTLWPDNSLSRALLVAFVLCNTVFLIVDGLLVGNLAASNAAAADSLWNSPATIALGDLTGALWCAALLAIGATRAPVSQRSGSPPGWLIVLAVLIWAGFVASLVTPAAIVIGSLALVFAVYRTYSRRGARAGVTFGLLALAALARQHVGVEAALGMVWIALAALGDALQGPAVPASALTGRSDPAASSPPGSG